MAYRFIESFGWPGTDINIFSTRYNTVAAGGGISTTGGRFANGPRATVNNSNRIDFNFPGLPSATLRVGTAVMFQDGAVYGSGNPILAFYDGNTNQCYLTINSASRLLELRRGDNTLLATASSIPIQNTSWYFLEVRVTFSSTVGQVSVQLDGTTVINTAANLNNITSGVAQASRVRIQGGNSGAGQGSYSDMFVADDVAAFQGDSRNAAHSGGGRGGLRLDSLHGRNAV
jgi:hypothetical protein